MLYLGPGKGYDGHAPTLLIPNVVGGAEVFGVMEDYTADTLPDFKIHDAIEAARSEKFAALLVRRSSTAFFTGAEFENFDIVALINLLDEPLEDPVLRAGSFIIPEPLLKGGWAHNPIFGGDTKDEILGELPAGSIYMTLVSENRGQDRNVGMTAGFYRHGQYFSGIWLGRRAKDFALRPGSHRCPTHPPLSMFPSWGRWCWRSGAG